MTNAGLAARPGIAPSSTVGINARLDLVCNTDRSSRKTGVHPTRVPVVLLEGRDHVLPQYPAILSDKAKRQLERVNVEVAWALW